MAVPEASTGIACPFDQRQLERAFSPLFQKSVPLRVCDVLFGNINTIIKVEGNGQTYGLRVRTQETVYRYEPDLIKEGFVSWLLSNRRNTADDTAIATAFAKMRSSQRGIISDHRGILPALRYFDWSRQYLPHPYCIYEWVDGVPLWDTPEPHLYGRVGQVLAHIHSVQLSAFYADFLAIGTQPVSWSARFQAALEKEVHAAKGRLRDEVIEQLRSLPIPSVNPCLPYLVHNDFAPGNIIVRDGSIAAIIDWDNAVIDAPHLDFVKMKYWTARDRGGELAHDPALFAAFMNGYGATGRKIVSSSLFKLYEVLWLLRVFNFERSKEEQGLPRASGYPTTFVYERFLGEVSRSIG